MKKSDDQREDQFGFWILTLPIFAMGVLMGIVALAMRTTGKW